MATAVLAAAALPSGTSAAGTLALLEEDDDSLKVHALQLLDKSVHDFWFQIAASIASIEALYEDEEFSHRELAALVVSKVSRADREGLGELRAGEQCDRRSTGGCRRARRFCLPDCAASTASAGRTAHPTEVSPCVQVSVSRCPGAPTTPPHGPAALPDASPESTTLRLLPTLPHCHRSSTTWATWTMPWRTRWAQAASLTWAPPTCM